VSIPSFLAYEECAPFVEGKRVVIVGSGPGALVSPMGFIDSFDVVVRVNNYGSGARHQTLGRRTDIHYSFFGGSITKTREELQADGVRLCMCKCPDSKPIHSDWHVERGKLNGIDFRYIYRDRAAFWFGPTFIPDDAHFLRGFAELGAHVPTTGWSAICDIAGLRPESLHLTGFDFFTSGTHCVDKPWKAGDHRDPIGHVPHREAALLRLSIEGGRWPFAITLDPLLRKLMEQQR
jgi:hypothetical protein